jgi:hypothetical protein
MMKNVFLIIIFCFLITGCEELTGSSTGADKIFIPGQILLGGLTFQELKAMTYRLDGSSDRGIRSSSSFNLEFNLRDTETISFYFYTNKNLSGGVELLFTRQSTDLVLKISLNGKSHELTLMKNPSFPVNLVVDVHNDHTDAHILIWEASSSFAGHVGCTEDESCLYNSEDFSFDFWLGVGSAQGIYWGYRGPKNSVINLHGFLPPKTDV